MPLKLLRPSALRLCFLGNYEISSVSPTIPTHRSTIHQLLPIRDHPSEISLALRFQSGVPLIRSVGDNPIVLLLYDPVEIGSVVVAVYGLVPHQTIYQDRSLAVLEDVCGVVHAQVFGQRVVCCIEADWSVNIRRRFTGCETYKVIFAVFA